MLELDFNYKFMLSENFYVTCIKDGFYDSGLLLNCFDEKILNLNDCEVNNTKRANEVYSITGEVDVLLTQFSFAAWKGGAANKKWRNEAAAEKIRTMQLQIKTFKPKTVIPFASYVYFSNKENFYLNDAANRPEQLRDLVGDIKSNLTIMAPNDELGGNVEYLNESKALAFWRQKYDERLSQSPYEYPTIGLEDLKKSFDSYCKRIHKDNNISLMKLMRFLSPISVFKPVSINVTDLGVCLEIDYVSKVFRQTNNPSMLSMRSESLNFIFRNSFGFDTLTVNGCFEEDQAGGFVGATKSLAIENLNNLGIKFEFKTLFNFYIIKLFLTRLYRVARKLE